MNPLFKAINDVIIAFSNFGGVLHIKNSPALYEMPEYLAAGFSKLAHVLISMVKPALEALASPLKTIGSIMSKVFHYASDTVDSSSTVATKITPEIANNVKQVTEQIEKFNMELKNTAIIVASEPLENLAKAINATNQQITNQVGKVLLEGREIGKFVLDTVNRKGNIDTVVKSVSTIT